MILQPCVAAGCAALVLILAFAKDFVSINLFRYNDDDTKALDTIKATYLQWARLCDYANGGFR